MEILKKQEPKINIPEAIILDRAKAYVMEWFASFPDLSRGPTRQRSHNREISSWSPPPIG